MIKNIYSLGTKRHQQFINQLIDIMSDHYGHKGKFISIDNPSFPMEDPIFTKDGYHIFNNLIIDDPDIKFLWKIVNYIASKISEKIGDGTTTGILLVLNMIRDFYDADASYNKFTKSISYTEAHELFNKIIDSFDQVSKKFSHTFESIQRAFPDISPEDIKYKIAYNQAFTSSHGDESISQAIGDMFRDLPIETLDNVMFYRSNKPNDAKVRVYKELAQYECQANITSTMFMNAHSNSCFISKNTTLYVDFTGLVDGNPFVPKLQYLIKNHFDMKKETGEAPGLVVLTTGSTGQVITELISYYSKLCLEYDTNIDFAMFLITTKMPMFNDVINIALIGGMVYYNPTVPFMMENVEVIYENATLKLFNLYDDKDVVNNLRPMYHQPNRFHLFHSTLKDLNKYIEDHQKANVHNCHIETIQGLIKIKNRLILHKSVTVIVGGSNIDNNATYEVVEDCVHSARKSIKDGFGVGGLGLAYNTLYTLLNDPDDKETFGSFDVSKYLIARSMAHWLFECVDRICINKSNESYDAITDTYIDILDRSVWDMNSDVKIIIQPKDTDKEIFKCIEEVLFKLFYSTHFLHERSGHNAQNNIQFA